MGDRGPAATYALVGRKLSEFSRWEIGGQPQHKRDVWWIAPSLADGRSGASRNSIASSAQMTGSLADGRSGASRNSMYDRG